MVIVLLFASLLGGSITLALLWPYGVLVAVLGAPFGGSIMTVLVGGFLALRGPGHDESRNLAREQATDEMVALLSKPPSRGAGPRARPLSRPTRDGRQPNPPIGGVTPATSLDWREHQPSKLRGAGSSPAAVASALG